MKKQIKKEKILIYTTYNNLNILENNDVWVGDETTYACPVEYKVFYTVHVNVYVKFYLLLYTLIETIL
jgi:hypothetical protein